MGPEGDRRLRPLRLTVFESCSTTCANETSSRLAPDRRSTCVGPVSALHVASQARLGTDRTTNRHRRRQRVNKEKREELRTAVGGRPVGGADGQRVSLATMSA